MQMKRETLVQKMFRDPGAVREFLDRTDSEVWNTWFPNHDISVKMKRVRNLMTGIEVVIPANTPIHLDPSSETYWSS